MVLSVLDSRCLETISVEPADVIIIEGILVLAMEEVRSLCHMKIFVDTDDDLRLARRLKRDTVDRGRSVDGRGSCTLVPVPFSASSKFGTAEKDLKN